MARDLTGDFQTALVAQNTQPIVLIDAHFPTSTLSIWTGFGDLTWNSVTYTGTGHLLKMSEIMETQKLQANGMRFIMSGNITALVELAEAEEYQNHPLEMYFGLYNNNAVVNDPFQLYAGLMDVMTIEVTGEEATIELTTENRMIDLERARKRLLTKEDQNLDYPDDTFFDFVPTIQDKEVTWGG